MIKDTKGEQEIIKINWYPPESTHLLPFFAKNGNEYLKVFI